MKEPERKVHILKSGGVIAIVLLIILVAGVSAYIGNSFSSQPPVTVAETTITSLESTTFTEFHTITTTESHIQTTTQTFTDIISVTQTLPPEVRINGTAASLGPGTSATKIEFVDANGEKFSAELADGNFTIALPNSRIYTVKIYYNAIPVGGECFAGSVWLETVGTSASAEFRC